MSASTTAFSPKQPVRARSQVRRKEKHGINKPAEIVRAMGVTKGREVTETARLASHRGEMAMLL